MAKTTYPPLDEAVAAAKQIAECLQTGIGGGDLLGHLKAHKKEFSFATWIAAGYLRDITVGMPGGIEPIGVAATDHEFIEAWSAVEAEYATEQGGLAVEGPLNWLQILIWLLQLLDRTN